MANSPSHGLHVGRAPKSQPHPVLLLLLLLLLLQSQDLPHSDHQQQHH
jgi:hypothetical protein